MLEKRCFQLRTYNIVFDVETDLAAFCRQNGIECAENILVQVFSGICELEYLQGVRLAVVQALPQAKLIGATTASEIIDGKIINKSCVLAISVFENTKVRTAAVAHCGNDCKAAGKRLAEALADDAAKIVIMFGDGLNTQGEEVLRGIASVDATLKVAGGLAGDNDLLQQTFVFTESAIYDSGIVGAVLMNSELCVYTDYNFDWEAFGKPLVVTAAKENIVYRIDGMTAAEVYGKYLGADIERDLPFSGQEFPLMAERGGIVVSRPILSCLPDGGVVTNAQIMVGEELHFGYNNFNRSMNSALNLRRQLESHPMQSLFIYNCTARLGFFKAIGVTETLPYCEAVPVSGFFSYGEFTNVQSGNQFVCQTMTVLALSEDPQATKHRLEEKRGEAEGILLRGNKGLCNLIKITSDELAGSNLELTAMNQELTAMNEELLAMSEDLNNANRGLEETNRELDRANRRLAHEVEERKQAQEQLLKTLEKLKQAQDQMLRSEKMAALGMLMTGMAHEINTPLGVGITAASHLESVSREMTSALQEKGLKPSALREYLVDINQAGNIIRTNLRRAAELVSSVRAAATKTELQENHQYNLKEQLDEIIAGIQPVAIHKKHLIELSCDEGLMTMISPGDLKQILGNLLMNSFIHAFEDSGNGRIVIRVRQENEIMAIDYCDDGRGMDEKTVARIFEPFFTTRRGRGCTGLGLYGVYNLVTQKMGGSITCDSSPGKGTCFFLRFPLL